VAAVVPLLAFAGIGLLGNLAVARGSHDLTLRKWQSAADDAARARRLMPWSTQPWVLLAEARPGAGDLRGARSSLVHALGPGRQEWRVWFDLALASHGSERRAAAARARALYPQNPDLIVFDSH
jgi:hypothetical protein